MFDAVTASFQVHFLKPAREIYSDMISKLGLLPQQCVYIDDIERYVDAAQDMGMHALHYRSSEGLRASLEQVLGTKGTR